MNRHRTLTESSRTPLTVFAALLAISVLPGCHGGPSVDGSFERTYSVTTPVRLDLSNASGDVQINGSADGKVHVHGEVRASGFGFGNPQRQVDEIVSDPPIEQKSDTILVGKGFHFRHVSIAYQIEVPRDTTIETSLASGSQTISDVRGPVHARSASGSIRVERVEREVQLTTASGSIDAAAIGDELRASSASGSITAANVKGDARLGAISGSIHLKKPGGRVEMNSTSGSIEVQGADNDVKARNVSGRVEIQGDPSANVYWELKTVSGSVHLAVPPNSNFRFASEAVSGGIQTDIPIVIEEKGKHSLRAHLGNGGGRVEVHTVSGGIHVKGSS